MYSFHNNYSDNIDTYNSASNYESFSSASGTAAGGAAGTAAGGAAGTAAGGAAAAGGAGGAAAGAVGSGAAGASAGASASAPPNYPDINNIISEIKPMQERISYLHNNKLAISEHIQDYSVLQNKLNSINNDIKAKIEYNSSNLLNVANKIPILQEDINARKPITSYNDDQEIIKKKINTIEYNTVPSLELDIKNSNNAYLDDKLKLDARLGNLDTKLGDIDVFAKSLQEQINTSTSNTNKQLLVTSESINSINNNVDIMSNNLKTLSTKFSKMNTITIICLILVFIFIIVICIKIWNNGNNKSENDSIDFIDESAFDNDQYDE
jgi:hypothetical protein